MDVLRINAAAAALLSFHINCGCGAKKNWTIWRRNRGEGGEGTVER